MTNYLFFSFSLIAAITMLVEGCSIVLLKKRITPLPTWILYGLGVCVVGSERSRRQFLGRMQHKDLGRYAACVLIFGTILLGSCLVFLFTVIL